MKVYAIICSGKYTDSINGELWTADRIEIIAAFTSQEQATAKLNSNPDVYEPQKWGVRAISIYSFEVEAAVPAPGRDETGWLIEKGRLSLGSSCNKPAWVTFTDPTAIRFARKVDAENMLTSLRSMSDADAFKSCTINGHMWCDVADSGATPKEG